MEFVIRIKVKKTGGPPVGEETVLEALEEELASTQFEAGDEPSVFEIEDAELAE